MGDHAGGQRSEITRQIENLLRIGGCRAARLVTTTVRFSASNLFGRNDALSLRDKRS